MVNYIGVTTRCCGPTVEARDHERKLSGPIRPKSLISPPSSSASGVSPCDCDLLAGRSVTSVACGLDGEQTSQRYPRKRPPFPPLRSHPGRHASTDPWRLASPRPGRLLQGGRARQARRHRQATQAGRQRKQARRRRQAGDAEHGSEARGRRRRGRGRPARRLGEAGGCTRCGGRGRASQRGEDIGATPQHSSPRCARRRAPTPPRTACRHGPDRRHGERTMTRQDDRHRDQRKAAVFFGT